MPSKELATSKTTSRKAKKIQPVRLYAKAVMMGFKRGLRNQHENTSILKIQNVREAEAAKFYCGKRVCFIYKAKVEKKGSRFRTIWGKVTRVHGKGGAVRAKFLHNMPAKAIGAQLRVMLYPSSI